MIPRQVNKIIPGLGNQKELKRTQPNIKPIKETPPRQRKNNNFPNLQDDKLEKFYREEEAKIRKNAKIPRGHYFELGDLKGNPMVAKPGHLVLKTIIMREKERSRRWGLWVALSKKLQSHPFLKFEFTRLDDPCYHDIQNIKICTFWKEFPRSMQELVFFGSDKNTLLNFRLKKRLLNFGDFKERETVDRQENPCQIVYRLNEEHQSQTVLYQDSYYRLFGDDDRFTYFKSYLSKGPYPVIQPQGKEINGEKNVEPQSSADA